jgi:hypothetical protein
MIIYSNLNSANPLRGIFTFALLYFLTIHSIFTQEIYYVQSPKAKLLENPKMDSKGRELSIGTDLRVMGNSGLFIQVRHGEKTGWVSKLFVSPFPPGKQIKLGVSSEPSEAIASRQRASDFTKTAAARGLSETEKLRVRGNSEDYDFESLRWLEKVGALNLNIADEANLTNSSNNNSFDSSYSWFDGGLSEDTKQELKIGRSLSAKLIKKYGLVQDKDFTIYLNQIGQKISSNTSRQDLSFRFGILNSDEINAFACPGGYIFITKGAINQIQSEEELVGVFAHEISHLVLGHQGKFQSTNIFVEIISSFLGPSGGEVITVATSDTISNLENQLFEQGRDEKTEWEADESAIYLMSQLGYQPRAFPSYIFRIASNKSSTVLSKTHPNGFQRKNKMESIIESLSKYEIQKHDSDIYNSLKSKI